MTSQHTFKSSTSEGSAVNSVDCDSGAQDLFGDALTLHDLRNTYPELYRFMLQTGNKIESPESSTKNSDSSWANTAFAKVEASFESDSDVAFAQLFGIHDSSNSLLTIRRAMSSIFDCLNAVHVQKTSKLRMEIRDLCCRLQSLQASREQDQHEIYRLQRELDRFRRELAHQAARYEDRITELHSVLAELKRKMERPNAVVDVGMAVQDLVEVSDDDDDGDVDHEDAEDDVNDDQVDGGNTGKQDQQKEQNASRNNFPLLSDWENNGVAAAVDSFGSLVGFSYSPLIANGANMAGGLIHSEPEDLMTSHNSVASGNASLEAQSCLAQSSIIDGNNHATKSPHNCQPSQSSGGWKQPTTVKHDLRGSPLSFLSDRRPTIGSVTKPVMGLRQQNQARKSRLTLKFHQQQKQRQLDCGEVNLNREASHLTQQISEPPFIYHSSDSVGNGRPQGTGLTKASSCEDRIRQSTPTITSTTSSAPGSSPVIGDIGHVNGLEAEPTWVLTCLSRCQGTDQDCLSPCELRKPGATTTIPEVWQSKETAPALVYGLLSGLAQTSPYPRLAEAAHRALLVLEQRDTAAASREAELLGLEASLVEAKASGDQLQCRLRQIESSWSAAMRAAELMDLALETGNILINLYASELALVLHKRWTPERDPRTRTFSSISSSSDSSSSSSSSTSSDDDAAGKHRDHLNSQRLTRKVARTPSNGHVRTKSTAPSADAPPSTARHPLPSVSGRYNRHSLPSNIYAVYALPKSGADDSSLNVSPPTYILPHEDCNGPACPRLLRIQRHQAEMAAISLLNRVTGSSDATYLKLDESDLSQRHLQMRTDVYESIGHSSMSVYVNSWYFGHSQAVGPRRPRVDCAGDGVPATFFTPASDFAACNGVLQSSTNQQSAVNAAAASRVPPSVSGWQTPDSGACSCSTNDASGSAATGPGIPLTSNVQCVYPPGAGHPGGHSASSSSSASSSVGPRVSPTASRWNRSQEFQLRQLFEHLKWERAMVRSTIAKVPAFHATQNQSAIEMPEHSDEAILYANDMNSGGEMNGVPKASPAPSKQLNALALVEAAALVQDLCAVKEERAKLKVQNYIMQKELRALQLNLQGRNLSESMLRSQLAAVLQGDDQTGAGGGHTAATRKAIEANGEKISFFTTLDSLRMAVETQRYQNEEFINDLKQANAALITAFEKAKSKYLGRIRKLEEQLRAGPQPAGRLTVSEKTLPAGGRGHSQSVSTGANAPLNVTNQLPAETGALACRPPVVPQHAPKTATRTKNDCVAASLGTPAARPPLPASPQSSDVYEVIQDSQSWYPPESVGGQLKVGPAAPNGLQQQQQAQKQQPLPAPGFYRPVLATTPPPRAQLPNSFQPQFTRFCYPSTPPQLPSSIVPFHNGSIR